MKMRDAAPPAASQPIVAPPRGRQLFRKYVGLFVTVVCVRAALRHVKQGVEQKGHSAGGLRVRPTSPLVK